jgi:hypothetical protein
LYNQVRHDPVALSGLGFFSFHKGIILSMASTIATYEIIILQNEFNTVYKDSTVSFCETIEKMNENILL